VLVRQKHRGRAVGGDERLGDRTLGEARNFGQDLTRGGAVELTDRSRIQHGSQLQRFEQVELDVAQICLVMPHESLLGEVCRAVPVF